jgi:hypothetical protein
MVRDASGEFAPFPLTVTLSLKERNGAQRAVESPRGLDCSPRSARFTLSPTAGRVPHLSGWTPWSPNALEAIANESPGCVLCGKSARPVPLSRRDILRIARRFNAGKYGVWHPSPEGTAEGWGVGLDFSRPFGTRTLLASNPALKRWAILDCPFVGTGKQRSSSSCADKTAPVSSRTTSG